MKLPHDSRFPSPENLWLPGVSRKAETTDEFMAWAKCAEMKPVFDKLASEALRLKDELGPDEVAGKRGLWLLLAVEAVCRQQSAVQLGTEAEAEFAEGIEIISEMALGAAGAYGQPEPMKSQEFWKDFIFALCAAWGGMATAIELDPHRLYAVQIRRLRDARSA